KNSNETSRRVMFASTESTSYTIPYVTVTYNMVSNVATEGITSGQAYTIQNNYSTKYAEVQNGSASAGSKIVQNSYEIDRNYQRFIFNYIGNGEYEISPANAPSMRLTVNSSKQIIIDTDCNLNTQRWYVKKMAEYTYILVNKSAYQNRYLAVNNNSINTILTQNSTFFSNEYLWTIKLYSSLNNSVFKIKNLATTKYLTAEGGCAATDTVIETDYFGHKTNIIQRSLYSGNYHPSTNPPGAQQFRIVYREDKSAYTLSPINSNNGKHLVVSIYNGIPCLDVYSGTNTQLFLIEKTGDYYYIKPKSNTNYNLYAISNSNISEEFTYTDQSNVTIGSNTTNNAKWELTRDNSYIEMENYYASLDFSFLLEDRPNPYWLDTGYGNRWYSTLVNVGPQSHSGVDILAAEQTSLYAIADGVVKYVSPNYNSNGGYYIFIEYNRKVYNSTMNIRVGYFHLYEKPDFIEGEAIQEGQFIGYVGDTGTSSEAHVHLSININGSNHFDSYQYTINPLLIFNDYDFYFMRK
ncbi:MAG: RICIN domain-containing protein, partial [Clostridia bacterium]|nr:RICIN domain-containing protein [Clostridia bacterium]